MYALLKKVDSTLNDLLDDIAVERSQEIRLGNQSGFFVMDIITTSIKETIAIVNVFLKDMNQ